MGGVGRAASGVPPADLIVLVSGLATAWMISPEDCSPRTGPIRAHPSGSPRIARRSSREPGA